MADRDNVCVFYESKNVYDPGIRVDVDPFGHSHTATHEFMCRDCDGKWQFNGSVQIEIDYDDAQVTRRGRRD